jgi:BlaI family penicillinase repressor
MKKLPRISEAEWEVMKVLWQEAPLPASTIIERVSPDGRPWHPNTVKTLLSRLVRKRAVGFRRAGRAYAYRPLVSEADCAVAASESFLERVFGGSLTPLVAQFIQRRRLSAQEIAELRRVLDQTD